MLDNLTKPEHISPPEPRLTVDELLLRADALRPLLRERQTECEQAGELSEEINNRFIAAGFYRILQPRCFGGYEFALPDFIRVMIAIARGCSESAWVLALTSGHTVLAAQYRENQPSAKSSAQPANSARPVSACPEAPVFRPTAAFASMAPGTMLPAAILPRISSDRPWFAIPTPKPCSATPGFSSIAHQFKIVDNWDVIGMQGTGSRRVVIDDAFVSADRALWFLDGQGRPVRDQPGHTLHPNSMYHGWLAPLLISEVAAVSVGAARGALDIYGDILTNKKTNFPPFHARSHEAEFQQHFGEAQALIDTAEAALLQLAANYMDLARQHVQTGAPLDEEMERRLILMEQHVIRLAWDAVELMFRTSGTSAAAKSSPLGRSLRNLAVIRTHVTLQLDHTAGNAGRLHFGLPPLSRF